MQDRHKEIQLFVIPDILPNIGKVIGMNVVALATCLIAHKYTTVTLTNYAEFIISHKKTSLLVVSRLRYQLPNLDRTSLQFSVALKPN